MRLFYKLVNGEIIGVDKLLHFSFSFIIAYLTSIFLPEWYYILGVVLVVGLAKEIIDKKTPGKHFDTWDIIAGGFGGVLFIIINILTT